MSSEYEIMRKESLVLRVFEGSSRLTLCLDGIREIMHGREFGSAVMLRDLTPKQMAEIGAQMMLIASYNWDPEAGPLLEPKTANDLVTYIPDWSKS